MVPLRNASTKSQERFFARANPPSVTRDVSLPTEPSGARVGRGQASEGEKASYIRRMFGAIAPRYDLANTLISAGLHRRWKQATARLVRGLPGGRALDVCCGTGDLALLLARDVGPRGRVVGIDFSEEMLGVARRKAAAAGLGATIEFALGDAEALALPDAAFDGATVGFGIRNTIHPDTALRELHRVLRPGGRLAVLEFGTPPSHVVQRLYDWYSCTVVRWVGRLASRHSDAYLYLVTSIRAWPDQEAFAGMMVRAGFAQVHYYNLLWGIAVIHVGVRPAVDG
jgi:demethylmenaquinone methyltransferase/2-methoxy-6-polyprenyl-1,4-benzoquinol methylase